MKLVKFGNFGTERSEVMLNFIVCEDESDFAKYMKRMIDNYMMNFDMDYQYYEFDGYDLKFEELVKSDIGFKIFFLDIKTEKGSGLDAARKIREEYDDWISIIVVVTAFSEYRYEALGNRLYLLDFINKVDDCENRVNEALQKAMKNYDNRHKSLSYEYNHIIHKVEFRNIICIEKEQDSKRCIIKTTYGTQLIPKSLVEVNKLLDKRFLKVHRSMIINLDQIKEYDMKENKITFKNNDYTHLISRDKKRELMKRV